MNTQLFRVKQTSDDVILHSGLPRSEAERLARAEAAKLGWEPGYPSPEHFGIEIEPITECAVPVHPALQEFLKPFPAEIQRSALEVVAKMPKDEFDALIQFRGTVEERRDHLLRTLVRGKAWRQAEVSLLKEKLAAMDGVLQWFESQPSLTLERNDCSRLHKLKDAAKSGHILSADNDPIERSESLAIIEHTFVLKHDWARAFDKAEGLEDGIKLPYDICAFEYRVGGKTLIAIGVQPDDTSGVRFTAFVESEDYWYPIGNQHTDSKIVRFLWDQMRAVCIALDAEVATHTVVRASAKLNAKRAKSGKAPLPDYRVVELSRRHRVANPTGGHSGRGVRLHFRRGHWRHYDDHRTWIKWMLVGNPDLGFIQKHYSL